MNRLKRLGWILFALLALAAGPAMAQQKKSNVVFVLADNVARLHAIARRAHDRAILDPQRTVAGRHPRRPQYAVG